MLDKYAIEWLRHPLQQGAKQLKKMGVFPDQVTCFSFFLGMMAIPLLAFQHYWLALTCILLNRIGDGLDGSLARLGKATDAGAFLDIVLDFIFYSGVIFGFALADPELNGLPAAALIFSFIGTGSSFLAYAIMAERRRLVSITYPHKGFYYLGGLAEATETILFFVAICLFPSFFRILAWIFAGICLLSTITRVWGGYRTLKLNE